MIVAGRTACEHSAFASRQRTRVVSGVFNTVPARLQKQALLWIHAHRFCRRDVEKQRVEQIVFFQGSEPLAVALVWNGLAGLIVGIYVPPMARDLGDAIAALRKVPPK